jgi:hypothetical protein
MDLLVNIEPVIYERFFSGIFSPEEVYFKLRVVKVIPWNYISLFVKQYPILSAVMQFALLGTLERIISQGG